MHAGKRKSFNPLFNTSSLKIPRKRRPVYRPTIHTILAAAAVLKLFSPSLLAGKGGGGGQKINFPFLPPLYISEEGGGGAGPSFFLPSHIHVVVRGNTFPFLRMKRKLSSGWKRQRISSKHVGNNSAFSWASKASFFFTLFWEIDLDYYSFARIFLPPPPPTMCASTSG